MNPADPLAELRGIHLPNEISNWPPAIGWWILSLLAVVTFIGMAYWFMRWYKSNAYRRAALKELKNLERQFQQSSASELSGTDFQKTLVELLKRTTLTVSPRTKVARLSGNDWLTFLDESASMQDFNTTLGQHLVNDRFSAEPANLDVASAELLIRISREWIKKHR
ncbi:MAG: DUF4381 domain-containing protein [Pseudomonadales bacterium]|nr:DUF4381 domain-containing protein [Pseudomonadales bacterium]